MTDVEEEAENVKLKVRKNKLEIERKENLEKFEKCRFLDFRCTS